MANTYFAAMKAVDWATGVGCYTSGYGFNMLAIRCGEQSMQERVTDILFAVTDEVCETSWDPNDKIIAFPDEDTCIRHFETWKIRLEVLPKKALEIRRPRPEDEITLPLAS
jgi:hypothetical protein